MLKVKKFVVDTIPVDEMKTGEIGIITHHKLADEDIGTVVVRYKKSLIALTGKADGAKGWDVERATECGYPEDFKVQLLKRGTTFFLE